MVKILICNKPFFFSSVETLEDLFVLLNATDIQFQKVNEWNVKVLWEVASENIWTLVKELSVVT